MTSKRGSRRLLAADLTPTYQEPPKSLSLSLFLPPFLPPSSLSLSFFPPFLPPSFLFPSPSPSLLFSLPQSLSPSPGVYKCVCDSSFSHCSYKLQAHGSCSHVDLWILNVGYFKKEMAPWNFWLELRLTRDRSLWHLFSVLQPQSHLDGSALDLLLGADEAQCPVSAWVTPMGQNRPSSSWGSLPGPDSTLLEHPPGDSNERAAPFSLVLCLQ